MDVTQEYTLNEVTEVAQEVFSKLKSMETKILKANLEQENLIQYVGSYGGGPHQVHPGKDADHRASQQARLRAAGKA
ncbi:hypothetical protein CYMTET_25490, partial [Cymbomonas tetramitiformis]